MSYNCRIKLAALSSVLLCACATPTVVQSVKPGDNGLSCAQLQNEFADAERFRAEAVAEKSVTGGNVVRAIFFWPAILGTASNANEAIAAADTRKVHLANQMNQKNCAIPITSQYVPSQNTTPTQVTAPSPQSTEIKLAELKRLYDSNLITKEIYAERQRAILGSTSN
jgi:archaellum component FlaF (FlaF/FlaG flagellin family)